MTTTALTPVRHEEIAICNATILAAVTSDDRCYFSPRHVCEALGVTWQGQHVKIMADQVLARTVKEIVTVAADGKQRNKTMLPIEFLSGWLFTIKKVRPEVQDKLNVFRAEGFVALDAWFRKGLRHSPSVADMLSNPDFAIELLTKFKEEQEARRRAEANAREVSEYNHKLSARVREKEEVITENLRYVTTDEWRALNHLYLKHGDKVRLGLRATQLHRELLGEKPAKQRRLIQTAKGERETFPNVYPTHILNRAAKALGFPINMKVA